MATPSLASQRSSHPQAPDAEIYELLTVDDVARLLKVSKSWVYEHTRAARIPRAERLPHVKIGKYVRFRARHLEEFLSKRAQIR